MDKFSTIPGYINLSKNGELEKRALELKKILKSCTLCPRECKINRVNSEKGFCNAGIKPKISSYNIHNGEEPPISGDRGSGTIFFTGCTMRCVYCQNFPISQLYNGIEYEENELADIMLELQKRGAHNINLVTPTHYIPQFASALILACKKGLKIPIVYNTSGYENVSILKLLSNIVDVYLPDIKYANENIAIKYSKSINYCDSVKKAVIEMHDQVGDLITDENGIAIRGLIIRHLVLPSNLAGSGEIMHFIAENISRNTYLSLMSQYFPAFHSHDFPELCNPVTKKEYEEIIKIVEDENMPNGWIQPII
ncbi:radical SAM protein [Candidatus Desantisbacteria bacterium]|nr:radical SAM protein [Candidatus Desantisbacteria bacterium]